MTHEEKYQAIYDKLPKEVVSNIRYSILNNIGWWNNIEKKYDSAKEALISGYEKDKNLNIIPLKVWDNIALHLSVNRYAGFEMSLAEKVCLSKFIARLIIKDYELS